PEAARAGSDADRTTPGRIPRRIRNTERASLRNSPGCWPHPAPPARRCRTGRGSDEGPEREVGGKCAGSGRDERGRDRSGWVDGKPPTQPNLRLLPAFPCETAPMTPVPGADATTRRLP